MSSSKGGGIIFFLHTIKTGGTTIRDNFSNRTLFPQVQYVAVYTLKQFRPIQQQMEQRLNGVSNDGKILFVELHGHNTPTLMDLAPTLRDWKSRATTVPLFVFTLLRDPVDFAVSFFNFFHVFGDPRFGPSPIEGTLQNFHKTLQWNPQCLYLVRGERPFFRPSHYYNVTQKDCEQVATVLEETMNWVGDTRTLSSETLPLLEKLVTGNEGTQAWKSSNVAATRQQRYRPLSRQELDESTVQLIRTMTQLDQQLYYHSTERLIA